MFVTVTICMNYFKEIKVPERAGTPSLCVSGFVSRALARSVLFLASACGAELDGQLRGVHAGLRLLWLLEPLALCVLTGTWGSSLLCVRCRPLPPGGPEPGGPCCSVCGATPFLRGVLSLGVLAALCAVPPPSPRGPDHGGSARHAGSDPELLERRLRRTRQDSVRT